MANPGFPTAGNILLEESPAAGMPSYLTPLIGRDEERRRLADLITSPERPIVVITGAGGIGKTRLAVQVANDLQRSYRHGTRFLSFASVPPDANLGAAFAWQLGLRDAPHQSHRERIQQRLLFREILLVVDNVEHLPDIAALLASILAACASVAILVTSRAELGLYGEITFALQPLSVRPVSSRDASSHVDPDQVRQSPAVRLFIDRVRAVQPDFEVTTDNAADTLAICEHLGGVPLALELTASQMAGQSTAEVLENLAVGFTTPLHPYSHLLRHQVSLRETVRASYDLLSPAEQGAFRTLCIMRGQWSIDDVLPLLTAEMSDIEAIRNFESLTARSLVQAHHAEPDELRFVINPVLRRFGEGQVAMNGEQAMLAVHGMPIAWSRSPPPPNRISPGRSKNAGCRVWALHEDFRTAHAWLMDHHQALDALRLSTGLWRYAYTRGQYQDARAWITQSIAEVDDHDELRGRALNGAGLLANVSGDLDEAQQAHERALVLATRTAQHAEIALGRIGLADVAMSAHDDAEAALRHLDIARTACERVGEPRGIASVLTNRGNIEWNQRNLAAAFTTHEEARVLYEQAGDTRGMAWSDANTGRIAAQQQRYDEAIRRLNQALDLYESVGDLAGCAEIMEAIGKITLALGDLDTSSILAGAATALRESIDSSLKHPDLEEFDVMLDRLEQASDHDHPSGYERGRSISLGDALDLARSVTSPGTDDHEDELDHRHLAHDSFGITAREHEALLLVCQGLTDQGIADRMAISLRTVHTHIHQLMDKLDTESRLGLIGAAHRSRIVPVR